MDRPTFAFLHDSDIFPALFDNITRKSFFLVSLLFTLIFSLILLHYHMDSKTIFGILLLGGLLYLYWMARDEIMEAIPAYLSAIVSLAIFGMIIAFLFGHC